jgi:endogenous inhibitor of DNA gyrase (YacG/DUF329 family)
MSEPSKSASCTICGKPQQPRFAPFCSRRCADIDLGRWLKGGYAIPGPPQEEQSEEPAHDKSETED